MRIEILVPDTDIVLSLMNADDKPEGVVISCEKLASFSESPNVKMFIDKLIDLPLGILLGWIVHKLVKNKTKSITINNTTINLIESSTEDAVTKIQKECEKQCIKSNNQKGEGEE